MRRVAVCGLLLAGAACTSVKPVQPAEFIPQHKPETVWVTYTDNSYVPVEHPTVVGDTLKGMWAGMEEPVVIPFSQIQTVQAKTPNSKRTVILVSVLGLAAAGVAYTVATSGDSGNPNFNGCGATKGTANTVCCDGILPGEKDNIANC